MDAYMEYLPQWRRYHSMAELLWSVEICSGNPAMMVSEAIHEQHHKVIAHWMICMYLLCLVQSYQDGIRSRPVCWDILLRDTLTLSVILFIITMNRRIPELTFFSFGFFVFFGDLVTSTLSFLFIALDWSGNLTAVETLPLEEGEPFFFGLVELGDVFSDPSQVCTVSKGLVQVLHL